MAMEILENKATVEDVLREVSKIKSIVKDAVDDGVRSALKTVKQGREAAEDAIDDAKRAVKQNPLEAVGIVFVAGVVAGCLAAWVGMRRR
jgi:ElaB/YqjD/DUF883 family membrane-anchored ribosome-binding protein